MKMVGNKHPLPAPDIDGVVGNKNPLPTISRSEV
jgi:hypothetical protein